MAVRTSLTWIKRRFNKAIRNLAESEGWTLGHWEFTGTYDENSGRFSLVFGTDLPLDRHETYRKILDALRGAFAEYPSIISRVGLVIQNVGDLEEVFQRLMIAEDEIDLGDLRTLSA